jgi:hypothetical protein
VLAELGQVALVVDLVAANELAELLRAHVVQVGRDVETLDVVLAEHLHDLVAAPVMTAHQLRRGGGTCLATHVDALHGRGAEVGDEQLVAKRPAGHAEHPLHRRCHSIVCLGGAATNTRPFLSW